MDIKYFDDKLNNLKRHIKSNNPISFNQMLNLTGWENRDLTYVLKKLLDLNLVEEYFDEKYEKILYKFKNSRDDDMITIQERIQKFENEN